MLQNEDNNRRRQESEILMLSNVYNCNELSYTKGDTIECYCNIFPNLNDSVLKLKNVPENNTRIEFRFYSNYLLKYLPPIRIYLEFPDDYPTKSAPNFYITTSWLSPWQLSLICQKLDEIWLKNEEQEILFLWLEFLRNDLLNFLQIKGALDVSFLYMIYHNLSDYFKLNLTFKHDVRAIHSILFFDPIQFLINYDKQQHIIEFEKSYYTCTICLEVYRGMKCIEFKDCKHVYCKKCVQEYIATNINEGTVVDIRCPALNCNFLITFNEVKDLCPNLFSKYESSLLKITLSIMNDVIYCPRISCQCPLVKDSNNTLAICNKCDYTFCSYCYKAYHGAVPCTMVLHEAMKLIEDYRNSNRHQKQLLEKKYGRRQIQAVVESHLTKEYLKKNATACPNCHTMIEKINGCNKMTCIHCKAYFCWLCGKHITTQNAYDHYLSKNNPCYRRLFDEV